MHIGGSLRYLDDLQITNDIKGLLQLDAEGTILAIVAVQEYGREPNRD